MLLVDLSVGLDCDITYHNPLALKNTLLLRAYSEIDPRVRIVAYIIKHWAKSRQVNNPADGTLSSYGFILCFIHFLQIQSVPILPNLQAIPIDWSGEALPLSDHPHYEIPKAYETNIVDGSICNLAYHHPTLKTLPVLKANASKNLDSPALLLIKFFHYFAWNYDYSNDVISIRSADALPSPTISRGPKKIDKAEADGWQLQDRLCIEDPFETWYDVAHVIKKSQMKYMKKEFLRAFTLISRAGLTSSHDDALPKTIDPRSLLELICEPCEPPPFTRDNRKKAEDDDKDDEDEENI
jgi:DNA polymerase sigma